MLKCVVCKCSDACPRRDKMSLSCNLELFRQTNITVDKRDNNPNEYDLWSKRFQVSSNFIINRGVNSHFNDDNNHIYSDSECPSVSSLCV